MDRTSSSNWDTIVLGAGAAGLIAAERSAAVGRQTLLLEKSNKPGVKILMSGGTRCNLTQNTDRRGIVDAFGRQGRFLHSALSYLDPQGVVRLFEQAGVATKVESTGKIFPQSDRALDVRNALVDRLDQSGAQLRTGEPAERLELCPQGGFTIQTARQEYRAQNLILTVGGRSYPGCGTTGDGYRWLEQWGHSIVPLVPALAPLLTHDSWMHELKGIAFEDAEIWMEVPGSVAKVRKLLDRLPRCRGGLLLTHFGLSGPAPMNLSRVWGRLAGEKYPVYCDLFPGETQDALLCRLTTAINEAPKRAWITCLFPLTPQRFAEALFSFLNLDPDRRGSEVPRKWLIQLTSTLKRLPVNVRGTRGFEYAEVTSGGVELDEVDSKSMQSKRVPGLYLAGEILNLDGPIGGFNFQAAFSTGWVAGYQGQPPESYG